MPHLRCRRWTIAARGDRELCSAANGRRLDVRRVVVVRAQAPRAVASRRCRSCARSTAARERTYTVSAAADIAVHLRQRALPVRRVDLFARVFAQGLRDEGVDRLRVARPSKRRRTTALMSIASSAASAAVTASCARSVVADDFSGAGEPALRSPAASSTGTSSSRRGALSMPRDHAI